MVEKIQNVIDIFSRLLRTNVTTIAEESERGFARFNSACRRLSEKFCEKELANLCYDTAWNTTVTPPFYKCYPKAYLPTSISGALANGARMNVGGSQAGGLAKNLGSIATMRGALYYAQSSDLAKLEAYGSVATAESNTDKLIQINGLLADNPNEAVYKLTPKNDNPLEFVDFDKAKLGLANQCKINKYLAITRDMNGQWGDLKYPAPIQLLARWLTDSSGLDGIVFNSSVLPGQRNIVWFAKDDQEGSETFDYEEV